MARGNTREAKQRHVPQRFPSFPRRSEVNVRKCPLWHPCLPLPLPACTPPLPLPLPPFLALPSRARTRPAQPRANSQLIIFFLLLPRDPVAIPVLCHQPIPRICQQENRGPKARPRTSWSSAHPIFVFSITFASLPPTRRNFRSRNRTSDGFVINIIDIIMYALLTRARLVGSPRLINTSSAPRFAQLKPWRRRT